MDNDTKDQEMDQKIEAYKLGIKAGHDDGYEEGYAKGIDRGMTDMILFFEQQVGGMFLMDAIGDEDSINYAGHVLRRLHENMMERIALGNKFDGQDD
jgi:hypothetical protein